MASCTLRGTSDSSDAEAKCRHRVGRRSGSALPAGLVRWGHALEQACSVPAVQCRRAPGSQPAHPRPGNTERCRAGRRRPSPAAGMSCAGGSQTWSFFFNEHRWRIRAWGGGKGLALKRTLKEAPAGSWVDKGCLCTGSFPSCWNTSDSIHN